MIAYIIEIQKSRFAKIKWAASWQTVPTWI